MAFCARRLQELVGVSPASARQLMYNESHSAQYDPPVWVGSASDSNFKYHVRCVDLFGLRIVRHLELLRAMPTTFVTTRTHNHHGAEPHVSSGGEVVMTRQKV